MMKLTYSELSKLETFDDRLKYLMQYGTVGRETFGGHRYINQRFYSSVEWKSVRKYVIARDNGCDLGVIGHEIYDKIVIHHINPVAIEDFIQYNPEVLDPENLICVSEETHNLIHFGKKDALDNKLIDRHKDDTSPWRKKKVEA